jgi:hypothetical protein
VCCGGCGRPKQSTRSCGEPRVPGSEGAKESTAVGWTAVPGSPEKPAQSANDCDGFFDVAMGLVDVLQSALLQTLGEAIIFFAGDVVVGPVQQFDGAVQAAGPIEVGIDWRVFVDVFSIVDGGFLDCGDGVIDFVDGLLFLLAQLSTIVAIKVSPSVTQIA